MASAVIGVALAVGWPAAAFAYGGQPETMTTVNSAVVDPCNSIVVTGSGYQPGETVTLLLASTSLGTTTADTTGAFSSTVTVPQGTAAGPYSLVSTGSSGDTSSTGVTVGTGGCGVTLAAVSSGGLAFTGADIAALVGVGAVALGLGGMLLLVTRRRRTSTN